MSKLKLLVVLNVLLITIILTLVFFFFYDKFVFTEEVVPRQESAITTSSEDLFAKELIEEVRKTPKTFVIDRIYPTKDPSKYWVSLKKRQKSYDDGALWVVDTDNESAVGVSPLGTYFSSTWDLEYVDETTAVVRSGDLGIFKIEGVWQNHPRHPYWALSVYNAGNSGGKTFRLPFDNDQSFDVHLTPSFDPACEDLNNQTGDLAITNLVGGSLSASSFLDLKFYFNEPIPVTCIETEEIDLPPSRYISPQVQDSIVEYRHPNLLIKWPADVSVSVHVDQLQISSSTALSDIPRMMSFSLEGKPLEIKEDKPDK